MWLKKLLHPSKPAPCQQQQPSPQPEVIKKFEQQQDIYTSTIVVDIEPDTRYKNYKQIPHNSQIKFPLIALHETENILLYQVGLFQAKLYEDQEEWKNINVLVSDRQILISPNLMQPYGKKTLNYSCISMGSIQKADLIISKKKQPTRLKITLKNNRELQIKCVIGDLVNKIHQLINHFAFVHGVNKFYAYRYGDLNRNKQQQYRGWHIYNIKREFLRQGLITQDQGGLNLKYIQNSKGQICETYPQLLVIPSKVTDYQLKKCSQFRTKQRFPALTYILQYKTNCYSTLFRCSQNKVGVLSTRCKQDQQMLQYIGNLKLQYPTMNKNCKVYDARGYYAALGNMIAGKGYQRPEFYTNCEIEWLNIPNIYAVRQSYNAMMNYREQTGNFYSLCAQTGWYDYLYLIIGGAKSIAKDLLSGVNVVVHCSDGWDRTSQLCALSQLIVDPYYRTIQGFAVLIQKDWRHFGHKFRQRTGQYNSTDYHPYQKSPIFIQFLDCVFQLLQQFPLSFEFNQYLLSYLCINVDSNIYGTFMSSNIKQCKQLQLQKKTISIWSYIMQNRTIFVNPFFQNQLNQFWIDVSTQPKNTTVWRGLFMGDGITSQTHYQIMRHQTQRNAILKARFYSNQKEIQQLHKKLQELSK